ncbi:MAG: 3-hydroxyacyl-ACP dehydratase [Chitinophagales bacterium]
MEENILHLIPQRPPMVMVDHLLEVDDRGCKTSLRIKEGNIFVSGGKLTEPGLLEHIAQSAAARQGYLSRKSGHTPPIGYIGAIQQVEILGLPKINDEIVTKITIKNQIFEVMIISAVVCRNKIELARCEMKIFISNQQ